MALTTTANLAQAIRTVYSKEVLFFAQPVMKFEQFANVETQLSVEAGSDIKVLKYSNLATGGTLAEGTNMTTQALSASLIAVTVNEYGNGVSVTELLLRQSFDKIMTQTSKLLGLDYANVNDLMLRDSLVAATGLQVKYASSRASRDLLVAGDTFGTALVKDGVELLATNNVPKINGDFYCAFVHPHQARKMRDDSAWINASQYGAPDQIFKGEIGRYEDVVFVETTHVNKVLANAAYNGVTNTSIDTYQAILFGADAFAKAVALPVEMRDNGIEDFSRKHSLAWYGIQGAKRIDDTRVVMLESA